MKKIFGWLLALVMVLALVGCNSTPVAEDVETDDRFIVVVDQGTNTVHGCLI